MKTQDNVTSKLYKIVLLALLALVLFSLPGQAGLLTQVHADNGADVFSISGQVTDANSDPLSGVTISTGQGHTATTDGDGHYEFSDLSAGDYTLTLGKTGCTFEPEKLDVTVSSDVTEQNFTGTCGEPTYSISGQVTDVNSDPISGVAISTDQGHTATTDVDGNYQFSDLSAGVYTLTPDKICYTFAPETLDVTVSSDVTGQNFTGTCGEPGEPTYSISGQAADANGDPISDVTISTTQGYTATSDVDGNYEFSGLSAGDYTLTPNKAGCTFEPEMLDVTVSSDVTGQNFTGTCEEPGEPTYSISGQVADANGAPISDVSISTGQGYTATTDVDGNYAFSDLLAGDYTLTPSKTGCTFEPETLDVPVSSDVAGQNFTGTCGEPEEPTYSISGQAADANGDPISDVTISTTQGHTATTDVDGNYEFSGLSAGDYTLTPSKAGYTFDPPSLEVTAPPDAVGQDFIGHSDEPPTGDATIFFEPSTLQMPLGGAGDTQVQIKDVSNFYGIDFKINYDPAIVEVVDADLSMSGVQIAVGSLFAGQDYFVARNWVYTDTGVIEFSVALRDPAVPINGSGSLASITWRGLNPGISNLTLEQVKLSDRNSNPIAHSVENGLIEVIDVKITGSVYLQGRSDHSGTNIFLLEEACSAPVSASSVPIPGMPEAVTDANGYFEITPYPGQSYQCLQAFKHGYLVGQKEMPQEDLGAIELPGGDVTQDDLINIFDLALIASHYGGSSPTADINADGVVDIYDLVIAAGNYDKRGPVTDWQ